MNCWGLGAGIKEWSHAGTEHGHGQRKQPHAHLDHGAEDHEDREDESTRHEQQQPRFSAPPFFLKLYVIAAEWGVSALGGSHGWSMCNISWMGGVESLVHLDEDGRSRCRSDISLEPLARAS